MLCPCNFVSYVLNRKHLLLLRSCTRCLLPTLYIIRCFKAVFLFLASLPCQKRHVKCPDLLALYAHPDVSLAVCQVGMMMETCMQMDAAQPQTQSVRRVLLSSEALCLSVGHFLELSFGAHDLKLQGRSMHGAFVRYFGTGKPTMHSAFQAEACMVPSSTILSQMKKP